MSYNPLNRRMFLRGLGGYALTIPLLPSLMPSLAEAQVQSNLRFALVHSPLGRDVTTWYPQVTDAQMIKGEGFYAKALSEISGPISHSFSSAYDPIRGKIAILRGLDSMNSISMHNSTLISSASSADPTGADGFGYSIDAVLEESKVFYGQRPNLGAMRVAPNVTQPYDWARLSYTSKTMRGQSIPIDWNAQTVYNKMLNPNNVQALSARNAKIRGASNLVLGNFKDTMNSRRISAEDKIRLDSYMQLISEIDKSLAVPIVRCDSAMDPGNFTKPSDFHKAMFKMEAAALACGVTKITMHSIVHCDDSINNQDWHGHAHGGTNDKNPATGRSYQADYSRFAMDQVAYFLNLLDSIPDTGGTLLDNTLFIYGNEDSNGGHQHWDLAVLMAGATSKIKTGFMYDYRPRPLVRLDVNNDQLYRGRPYNNVLTSAFRALGIAPSDYQRQGIAGFGRYHNPRADLIAYYNQFLGAKVNDPLPGLMR